MIEQPLSVALENQEFLTKKASKQRIYIKDREIDGVICKCCTTCGNWLPHSSFCRNGTKLRSSCKICKSLKDKDYLSKNREKASRRAKTYYQEHREQLSTYQKKYHESHKEKRNAYSRTYWRKNRETLCGQKRKYTEENKERRKEYVKANIVRIREKQAERQRDRTKNDIQYRLKKNLRKRIYDCVVRFNIEKRDSTMNLLGCLASDLVARLESMFQPGMSWDNYGEYRAGKLMTWHIDHIRPCSSFDLTDPEQQKQCFHYTNLQPLWAVDNIVKGAKIE